MAFPGRWGDGADVVIVVAGAALLSADAELIAEHCTEVRRSSAERGLLHSVEAWFKLGLSRWR